MAFPRPHHTDLQLGWSQQWRHHHRPPNRFGRSPDDFSSGVSSRSAKPGENKLPPARVP